MLFTPLLPNLCSFNTSGIDRSYLPAPAQLWICNLMSTKATAICQNDCPLKRHAVRTKGLCSWL